MHRECDRVVPFGLRRYVLQILLLELAGGHLLLVHAVEVLLDAVLVLGPVVAQRARVQRRQAALDALVPPARVLCFVGTTAAVAPVDGRPVLVGGAQHVQRIDGGGGDASGGGNVFTDRGRGRRTSARNERAETHGM